MLFPVGQDGDTECDLVCVSDRGKSWQKKICAGKTIMQKKNHNWSVNTACRVKVDTTQLIIDLSQ